jgi:hypothetical protein
LADGRWRLAMVVLRVPSIKIIGNFCSQTFMVANEGHTISGGAVSEADCTFNKTILFLFNHKRLI